MASVFSRNSLEHAVAGSAGTVLATLLLFPLERLKTLLQVDARSARANAGLYNVCLRVLREEGAHGLYRGCGPMLRTVGSSNFLYFFLFEGLKEPLAAAAGRPEGVVGPYETLVSSAIAGALNMIVTEPLWRACVIAQAASLPASSLSDPLLPPCVSSPSLGPKWNGDDLEVPPASLMSDDNLGEGSAFPASRGLRLPLRQFSSVIQGEPGLLVIVWRLWRAEGLMSLWRGLGSSLWLVTNPVIQFFVYDLLKALGGEAAAAAEDSSAAEAFVRGAFAKALATVLTFPLQVAQSRLRAARDRGGNVVNPELQGMVPCLRAVIRESGLGGLYLGLSAKLLQTVTHAAFMFAFYEKVHWAIRRMSRKARRRIIRRVRPLLQ